MIVHVLLLHADGSCIALPCCYPSVHAHGGRNRRDHHAITTCEAHAGEDRPVLHNILWGTTPIQKVEPTLVMMLVVGSTRMIMVMYASGG